MKDLSIIIPFAGEYPQVIFTIQAIAESLKGKLDFEIIAVNNMCEELTDQWAAAKQRAFNQMNQTPEGADLDEFGRIINSLPPSMNDKAGEAIKACSRGNEWLKYMEYKERLSHWECKRIACQKAESDTFLFIDAHCIPSLGIDHMYRDYFTYRDKGTFHMPLTYKILEWHKLVYRMRIENDFYGYTFAGFTPGHDPYEVPCMSTCGMMISRKVYEKVGGWPAGMYAYGGGENFMNYALAVTGMKKWIYPGTTLHHHGEKRDYHYTYDGTLFNRLLAHYLFGGEEKLLALRVNSKGRPEVLDKMCEIIVSEEIYQQHREVVKNNQKTHVDEWANNWRDDGS